MDLSIKRLDHLGIIAGTIKDLGIIGLVDERLKKDSQGEVTQGEAVAAMILNGLGFVSRTLTLTPQFFETKPMDILLREGITQEQLNRHKLGRTLDAIAEYGCEAVFNEIALLICMQEKISLGKLHNDTTTFSVNGEYKNQAEDAEVSITYGYSKDNRKDLKQIILELCVARDGGTPVFMKPWSGNTPDNKAFNERIKELAKAIAQSDTGIVHIADSKLYTAENIAALSSKHFITRVPGSIKQEGECITQAIRENEWIDVDDKKKNKFRVFEMQHYGTEQRWVVVYSQQAHERAKKTMSKILGKQEEQLTKDLFHLQAQHFACEADARIALTKLAKGHKYLTIQDIKVSSCESHGKRGRPAVGAAKEVIGYKIEASFSRNQHVFDQEIEQRSCYVLATNIPEESLPAQDVITEYKGQDCVEKSFAFLKSPSFFVSSFFMKSIKRIQAMLVIMTLSLLIYAVAQRRLRNYLKANQIDIPNQIRQPSRRPTLRWIFQCLEGINYVVHAKNIIIYGMNELRRTILSCFGDEVKRIYQIS